MKSNLKNKYEFVFNIGEKVKIKELNIKGKINAIYIGKQTIEYNVRYFCDGVPKEVYFSIDELELITEEEKNSMVFQPTTK